jgi:hypothetical protein
VVQQHMAAFHDEPAYHYLLFALPRLLWRTSSGGAAAQCRAIVKRGRAFLQGEWKSLFEEAVKGAHPVSPSGAPQAPPPNPGCAPDTRSTAASERQDRARRCKDLFYKGASSRALAVWTAPALAPADATTVDLLRQRHPLAAQPIPPHFLSPPPATQHTLTRAQVLEALRTSARGSAGGPSGWTFDHLRVVTGSEAAESLLATHIAAVAAGRVPAAVRGLYTASRLIPLSKQRTDGRRDVRPVSVGEVFVRLPGRALCLRVRGDLKRIFLPVQFGVGVPCGAELIVRLIQRALRVRPGWVLLVLDLYNAFNEVERCAVFEAVEHYGLTDLLPYLQFAYGTASELRYQGGGSTEVLSSERGVRQGDPLGPALFALAVHRCVQAAHSQLRGTETLSEEAFMGALLAFLDDMELMGEMERVAEVYRGLRQALADIGLRVQPEKCVLYCPSGVPHELPEEFRGMRVTSEGVEVLGVPVGTPAFVAARSRQAMEDHRRGVDGLHDLDDSQIAFTLLRQCVAGRPTFLCRLMDPTPAWAETLTAFDADLWQHCRRLLGWRPGDPDPRGAIADAWGAARDQAFLPVRLGGLGLRSASLLAPLAYLSSWGQTLPSLHSTFAALFPAAQDGSPSSPLCPGRTAALTSLRGHCSALAEDFPSEQALLRRCPERLYQSYARRLAQTCHTLLRRHPGILGLPGAQERLYSVSGLGAGAWLTARPTSPDDRLTLSTADWQFAARFRLGLPIEALEVLGECVCGQPVSVLDAQHAVRCSQAGELLSVHEAVVHAVGSILRESGVTTGVHTDHATLRGYFTEAPPGTQRHRLPDLTYFRSAGHTEHALDVTVRVPQGSTTGLAAARAEQEKYTEYGPWMTLRGSGHFTPLAVEVFGCLGQQFERFFRDMACATLAAQGRDTEACPPDVLVQFYRQRVGVSLQRAISHSLRAVVLRAGGRGDSRLAADEAAVHRGYTEATELGGPPTCADLAAVEADRDF